MNTYYIQTNDICLRNNYDIVAYYVLHIRIIIECMSLANIWIPNSASFITEYTNTKRNGVKNVNGMKLKAGGKFKF